MVNRNGTLRKVARVNLLYFKHGIIFSSIFYLLAGLGEFRICDLNDEINKLLREKRH